MVDPPGKSYHSPTSIVSQLTNLPSILPVAMQLSNVTLFCFFASYVSAFALELTQFLRRSHVMRWAAVVFTAAGLVAQTIYLTVRSQQADLPPLLGSAHDWLLVSAWLLVVLYLSVQAWNRDLSLGVFCLPLVLILVGASRFVRNIPNPRLGQFYWWGMVHASFWVFGILGVLLALIFSIMYLVQHNRLKHKQAELPALHLLSLERLSRINWWLIVVSVPLLTLGMITGLWMAHQSGGGALPVSLANITFVADAVIWVTMALLFGWLLTAHHPAGRTVAIRTILACTFLLAVFLVMNVLAPDGIHGSSPGSKSVSEETAA